MKTWLVACSKGGVGKTTIATHLAAEAAVSGLRTALVDADPQGSATRWCERRAGMASAVLPLDGTRKSWRKHLPADTQRTIVDAPAGAMPAPDQRGSRRIRSSGTIHPSRLGRMPCTYGRTSVRPTGHQSGMAGYSSARMCSASR